MGRHRQHFGDLEPTETLPCDTLSCGSVLIVVGMLLNMLSYGFKQTGDVKHEIICTWEHQVFQTWNKSTVVDKETVSLSNSFNDDDDTKNAGQTYAYCASFALAIVVLATLSQAPRFSETKTFAFKYGTLIAALLALTAVVVWEVQQSCTGKYDDVKVERGMYVPFVLFLFCLLCFFSFNRPFLFACIEYSRGVLYLVCVCVWCIQLNIFGWIGRRGRVDWRNHRDWRCLFLGN